MSSAIGLNKVHLQISSRPTDSATPSELVKQPISDGARTFRRFQHGIISACGVLNSSSVNNVGGGSDRIEVRVSSRATIILSWSGRNMIPFNATDGSVKTPISFAIKRELNKPLIWVGIFIRPSQNNVYGIVAENRPARNLRNLHDARHRRALHPVLIHRRELVEHATASSGQPELGDIGSAIRGRTR